MDELSRILFIDDDEKLRDEILVPFEEKHIEVVFCPTKDEALRKIDSRQYFDLIILDWFLEDPESSILSQLVLKHLNNRLFVPVFIWSNHLEDFRTELGSGSISYPKILIDGISKSEVSAKVLKDRIDQWLSTSIAAQISEIYRHSINQNLERTFFELAEVPNEDIASILKILVGSEENIDWSNDFILNLVHRKLLTDNVFTGKLKSLIAASADNLGNEELPKRRRIINKVLYFQPFSGIIRCGDIVELRRDGKTIKYGAVVTPDCDIEQRNTRYVEIIEMRNIDDPALNLNSDQKRDIRSFKCDPFYYFPSLLIEGNLDNDFVAILKSKYIVEGICIDNEEKYPKVPQKLSYTGRFLFNGKEVQLVHICSKSNPYKSDFLQKLHTNNSRVGTPDIKDLLRP